MLLSLLLLLLLRFRYSVRVQPGRRRDGSDTVDVGGNHHRLLVGAHAEERSHKRFVFVPIVDEVRFRTIRLCRVVLPAVHLSVHR